MSKPESTQRTAIYPSIEPDQFEKSLAGKLAYALAESGASVTITARTQNQADETAEELSKSFPNVKVIGFIGDVCKRTDLESLVKEVTTKLGPIDILINNAGTNTFMPLHITDADEWWKQMEISVKAPAELTRIVLPSMQERNSGTIIFTSSRAAEVDLPWASGYSCAKTAITRFGGVLQTELNIL
ncbi:hypothetical protein DID88_006161 [Monilinia fructigena]|uniref:Ketoreductase (KR) domain-containing protein n=1 Tax=Monilinia fructigena TaxID=38457 RepID=A0A395J298_9HELO|nr:hypothetical protein DID88_006161 [Monilinia fructigena]